MAASTVSWWSSSPFLANKSVNPTKRSVPRSVSFPAKKCGEFRPLVIAMAGGETAPVGSSSQEGECGKLWHIIEDKEEIKMRFVIPGLVYEDPKVKKDVLYVKGGRKKEVEDDHGWYRDEQRLHFMYPLPCDRGEIHAVHEMGVLYITIHKIPHVDGDVPIDEKDCVCDSPPVGESPTVDDSSTVDESPTVEKDE